MTTPEKLKKAENRLDWGEASIYVPEFALVANGEVALIIVF